MPDEIAREVGEHIDLPFYLDYITSAGEYNKYIAEVEKIRQAVLQRMPRGQLSCNECRIFNIYTESGDKICLHQK